MHRWLAVLLLIAALPILSRADDDVKIGEFGSMTGPQATFGISSDNGVKLAVSECNATGGIKGHKIQLIADDDQGKSQETITVVNRLIQEDHVSALLGEVASSLSIAAGQVCQRAGVPMVSPSSTNPKVTAIGNMVFRVCFIDPFQGYVGAKFANDNLHLKTAAVLYDRSQAYSSGLRSNFTKAFEKMGGKVAIEQAYTGGDNDFNAQLTAIRSANVDFIYIPGYYTEVVNIAVQARKLGLTIPLIGGDGWDSSELKNAGKALDDCYYSNHYAHENPSPTVQDFVKKYGETYNGAIPDGLAATGYDAAKLLFDAMGRAKSFSGEDIAAALAETKDFKGVTGTITIDANRNAKKSAVMLKITDGVSSYAATIDPPQ
ncbi:MAG: ABC transporter substrate-binding protein [Phycisphaerae bacterium]|nr:ABC transporter substrate-binding protein [Phycisphaerae bacterium]